MSNTYISCFDYVRAATGQETASLVGNVMRLSGTHTAGALSLTVTPATTVDLSQYDRITIFDGSSTEVVIVSADTPMPATALSIQTALAFNHADGTACCSDGPSGSLADEIVSASDMLEDACLQPLLQHTNTDVLSLQTMRAAVDNAGVLTLRPMQFPVQSVSALTVTLPSGTVITLDATRAFLDSGGQIVTFQQLIPTGSVPFGSPFQTTLTQRLRGTVSLTYVAGYAYAALPPRVKKAAILFTSELIGRRSNPLGAEMVQLGKKMFKMSVSSDASAMSGLTKQAHDLLSSWKQENW